MNRILSEPFRLFFPLGVVTLLWGALLWLPLIWAPDSYPVLLHRTLMLNGFAASFIGGFLMTAVPRFSQTWEAKMWEVVGFLILITLCIACAIVEKEKPVFILSSLEALWILIFLAQRIPKRKMNPPYSFVFIFVGLFLWIISGILCTLFDPEAFKPLLYEGAIAAIILGVGSRLIPGILGHVEIVNLQKRDYEKPSPIYKTLPADFGGLIATFIASYFLSETSGHILRALVVGIIAFKYWQLWKAPVERSALTWSIWTSGWLIVASFVVKIFITEGLIHMGHAFFINGIVLLSLMVGTRVLQSHGPKDKTLENRKVLYLVTFLLILASATRVSAYLMPETYLTHLAYSSVVLSLAVIIWSWCYLRFIRS